MKSGWIFWNSYDPIRETAECELNIMNYHEFNSKGICTKCGIESNIQDLRPHSQLCPGNRLAIAKMSEQEKPLTDLIVELDELERQTYKDGKGLGYYGLSQLDQEFTSVLRKAWPRISAELKRQSDQLRLSNIDALNLEAETASLEAERDRYKAEVHRLRKALEDIRHRGLSQEWAEDQSTAEEFKQYALERARQALGGVEK